MPVMLDEHDERAWIGGVSRDVAPLIAIDCHRSKSQLIR
jgi:hypothetical protein